MKLLLNYIFSDRLEKLKPELIKNYDEEFIDNTILNPIKSKFQKL